MKVSKIARKTKKKTRKKRRKKPPPKTKTKREIPNLQLQPVINQTPFLSGSGHLQERKENLYTAVVSAHKVPSPKLRCSNKPKAEKKNSKAKTEMNTHKKNEGKKPS
jgi:hypothetical protein